MRVRVQHVAYYEADVEALKVAFPVEWDSSSSEADFVHECVFETGAEHPALTQLEDGLVQVEVVP